jgi:hypothetical protein
MSAKRFMLDSGNVTRRIRKRWIIDSGGVARLIKKRWVIDAGGVARLTYQYADALSLLAGTNPGVAPIVGYFLPAGAGSLTPSVLGDGMTVSKLCDTYGFSTQPNQRLLEIQGFTTDPGRNYLFSLLLNGVTVLPANVTSYTFTPPSPGIPGTADWTWTQPASGLVSGTTYPVVLTRS